MRLDHVWYIALVPFAEWYHKLISYCLRTMKCLTFDARLYPITAVHNNEDVSHEIEKKMGETKQKTTTTKRSVTLTATNA